MRATSNTLYFSQGEHLQGKEFQDFIVDKIDDLKGQDIVALDVQGKSSITDCMIICTGTSNRQPVGAFAGAGAFVADMARWKAYAATGRASGE